MGALLLREIPRDKTPLGRLGRLGAAPEVPQQGGGSWVLAGDEIQRVLTWHWGGFPPANYQLRGIKPVFLSASLLLGLGSRAGAGIRASFPRPQRSHLGFCSIQQHPRAEAVAPGGAARSQLGAQPLLLLRRWQQEEGDFTLPACFLSLLFSLDCSQLTPGMVKL